MTMTEQTIQTIPECIVKTWRVDRNGEYKTYLLFITFEKYWYK